MRVLDSHQELGLLRGVLEEYTRGTTTLEELRTTVDSIVERWRAAAADEKPPVDQVEGRLWHVVWQIEVACSQELAPDGARTYLDILDGRIAAPPASEHLRP